MHREKSIQSCLQSGRWNCYSPMKNSLIQTVAEQSSSKKRFPTKNTALKTITCSFYHYPLFIWFSLPSDCLRERGCVLFLISCVLVLYLLFCFCLCSFVVAVPELVVRGNCRKHSGKKQKIQTECTGPVNVFVCMCFTHKNQNFVKVWGGVTFTKYR